MVEVFKTDVSNANESWSIGFVLSKEFTDSKINFDLSDCDKVLRIESPRTINVDRVQSIVNGLGYQCQVLL